MSDKVFVALGDSLAEGRGDPVPTGGFAGWVQRLSRRLRIPDEDVLNLGRLRATSAEVVDLQLPQLHSERPRLIAVVCGINDVFGELERARTAANIEMMISAAAAVGATTVTSTLPEVHRRVTAPGKHQQLFGHRLAELNADIRRIATIYDAHCLDLFRLADITDETLWCSDRIHASPLGHDRIARGFADLLGVPPDHAIRLADSDSRLADSDSRLADSDSRLADSDRGIAVPFPTLPARWALDGSNSR